jgi:2-methylisocitrate lyase-like PEP mutase family enzyme
LSATQQDKANALRQLHEGPSILVLPNAWDVASARLIEDAGFPAIATTSAGVAWAQGYLDGERISRKEMAEVVRRVARAVGVPVTADMEAGYGPGPDAVAETVRAVIAAGAVGLNLEDWLHGTPGRLRDLEVQVECVRAARQAGVSAGVPVVINARTDVYLEQVGAPEERFEHAVRRANAYRDAGADCLFVPGVRDAATIDALVRAIRGPVNILAGADTPSVPELERMGVRRVSMGSGPMRATLTCLRGLTEELRERGTYASFTGRTLSHAQVNQLLSGPRP